MAAFLRLALVQQHATEDPAENLERADRAIRHAAKQGAQLICLPELFRSRYFPQEEDAGHFDLAEPIPGPTTQRMGALANDLGVVIVASLFERRAPGLCHNTAAVLERDGSLAGIYRKMHVPDDPRFYEKFYFAPGDLGFHPITTSLAPLGVLVCWDQWFPEAARLMALRGAPLLLYPTAIATWDGERHLMAAQQEAWRTAQRAHAIANGCFVAAVNRTGQEEALRFWGGSFVVGPDGALLAEAGETDEILSADLDLDAVAESRRGWPFFRDRRIDAYDGLLDLWAGT